MMPIALLFNGVWSQYVFAMAPKYRDFYGLIYTHHLAQRHPARAGKIEHRPGMLWHNRLNKPGGKTGPVNRSRPLLYNLATALGVLGADAHTGEPIFAPTHPSMADMDSLSTQRSC